MEAKVVAGYITEELHDVNKYIQAYKETGCGIYYDLACEELSHARILCKVYESMGGSAAEFKADFEKAESKFHSAK